MSSLSPKIEAPKIIIAGAPAAGKGTQCEVIKTQFGVVHLSTGDILRAAVKEGTELGLQAKAFMDGGKLVPDELIIGVVCDRLKQPDCQKQGWLLDGFPRTRAQADALQAAGMVPDCFVLLDVPEGVLVERVTGRRTDPVTGKIYHMKFSPPESDEIASRLVQRSDDTEEKIVVRYRDFQSNIDSVRSCYEDKMILVDGTASQSEVSYCVKSALNDALFEKLNPIVSSDGDDENDDDRDNNSSGSVATGHSSSGRVFADKVKSIASNPTVLGMASLIVIDKLFAKLFRQFNIGFPSSLGAMVTMFLALTSISAANPAMGESIADSLGPSVAFIKAWLALFFVPPLVVLPLKAHLLNGMGPELVALIAVGAFTSLAASGVAAEALNTAAPGDGSNGNLSQFTAVKQTPLPALPSFKAPLALSSVLLLAGNHPHRRILSSASRPMPSM